LEFVDYLIIITYFLISFGIATFYSRRAGKSTYEFFLSGRKLPWYLAGISMVATTFAADTPLAVTELVAQNGIAGNWIWWNFAFGGLLTVFFFARLWRRSGIITEAEFAEIRYSGRASRFLRGFRAVYLGLIMNIVIIGWVNKSLATILVGLFGIGNLIFGNHIEFLISLFLAAVSVWIIYKNLSSVGWGTIVE
jgi:Na+/proline symporter